MEIKSNKQSATKESITTLARLTIQGSCRPLISKVVLLKFSSILLCFFKMEGVGFNTHLKTIGSLLDIPPFIPPLLLVKVLTLLSLMAHHKGQHNTE